jgi:hypothetical protein
LQSTSNSTVSKRFGFLLEAVDDLLPKLVIRALRPVTNLVLADLARLDGRTILVGADFFHESGLFQRVQHAKHDAFVGCSGDHIAEPEHFVGRCESPQDIGGVGDGLNEIRIANQFAVQGVPPATGREYVLIILYHWPVAFRSAKQGVSRQSRNVLFSAK